MAAPIIIAMYLFWKAYSKGEGGLYRRAVDMDLKSGMRELDLDPNDPEVILQQQSLGKRLLRIVF
jgi:amino acid permease